LRGSPVSGVSVIFGTAVMARRTGRRDRGVRRIPYAVDAGEARVDDGSSAAVPVGFTARAPRVREGKGDRGFEGNN
jgi:hypothetical protein